MIWNKYSVKLLLFLIFLNVFGFGFFWSFYSSQLVITKIVFLIGFIFLFITLLNYLNKTNRDLSKFIEAIQYVDNVPSNCNSDLSHGRLQLTYNRIIHQLKKVKLAKESEHQYFKFVLEHIGIGIISFDKNGKIEIYNKSAKTIFGLENLDNVLNLNKLKENLGEELLNLKAGKTKLFKFNGNIEYYKILAKSTEIKLEDKSLTLISLQNIKTQLEESELEAWQKLIRVLTHEIMNSVTPIKSLTYSMQKSLSAETENPLDLDNILKGLNAIENRSKGLLDFVESYKNLTQIPKPNYERVYLNKMFQDIKNLLEKDFEISNVQLKIIAEPNDLSVIADGKLISQVLINLIRNSIYALEGNSQKRIELIANLIDNEKVCIKVVDSGKGISSEIIDKIFIPFFTTREHGSGIGLSFARQVMVLHNGSIDVHSAEGNETIFTLSL